MTYPTDSGRLHQSFAALPEDLADLLRPGLPHMVKMIIDEIGRCVPEFAPLPRADPPSPIQEGVELCLWQFVDQIASSPESREESGDHVGQTPA